jgi:hypothetical protein
VRRLRTLGVCLIAAAAVAAVVASAASAGLPEFGGCEATAGGKYSDAACTVKASPRKTAGKYEWNTGAKFGTVWLKEEFGQEGAVGLENETVEWQWGPVTFEASDGTKVQCNATSELGEGGFGRLHPSNTQTSQLGEGRFEIHNCEAEGQECFTLPYGDVNNRDQWAFEGGLVGKLVFISGKGTESPVVGLAIGAPKSAETGRDVPLLVMNCEAKVGTIDIGGEHRHENGNSVIAVLKSGVDEMTSSFRLAFQQSHGMQEPAMGEHGKHSLDALVESLWQPVGIEGEVETTPEGAPLEIKAKP